MKPENTAYDSLLNSLVLFTKLYHKPYSAESLTHGLPLENEEGRPVLFSVNKARGLMSRAAQRAGLKSTFVKKDLDEISPLFLPMILLLKNRESCILESFSPDGKEAKIVLPDAGESHEWVDVETLEKEYTGYGFLLKRIYDYGEREQKRLNLDVKHWFWDSIRHSYSIYKDVIMASILVNIFVLATPLFTRTVYNRVIPNQAVETLWYFAGGVVVIYLIDLFLKLTRTYFLEIAAKKSDIIMSSVIFEKVLDMQMKAMPKSVGSFASNLKDFDAIRSFLTSATLTTLIDIPFAILFLVVIWYLGGPIVWVPIVTILLIIGYALLIRKPLYRRIEQTHQAAAHKNGILVEALHNLETIKTLGAAGRVQWEWEEATGEVAEKSLSARLMSASLPAITSFLVQFNTVLVVVVGVYLIKEGTMTMGDLIAIVILVSRTVAPMGQAASLIANYEDVKTVYRMMEEIVNQPVERPEAKEFVQKPHFEGKIEFKDVTFSYPDEERPAIQNVSFTIAPGERVGLIGRIGSGKSTILKLAMHLYEPDEGAVLIDDIDIKQIDPADLRANVAYVDQHVKLFRGTMKENLKYGNPYIDDERMIEAAKASGVHEFVQKHPKGYEMMIGEQGVGLSGGQKQSVAIARALMRDASIVMMDEPTNAMDQVSEARIIALFKSRFRGKTLLLSTQKLSLLEAVDRVIVMHEGKIYLDGPRDVVLKTLRGENHGKA
ncbi:type I secretion system permease/ATPase [Hydrogenimonas urashimensis]|uniref:type I secretion system permease/ATPase n=1 Tax=Hydrogenimonas urashimensis TaxID=2740515 RepID=UPI001915EA75|nr:type I secretion system permease/ATPase [Hydrogenimonas urashimensis]